jgi:trk system potassium uptake protein TrkA
MRVAIAGAGAVGRSIATDLRAAGHTVLLIEQRRDNYRPHLVPHVDWMLADACELTSLQAAGIQTCDAVVAATGDDRVNLVFALLAKSEFSVPRVVARTNDPANQWLFTSAWGVDVAVSTPGALVASVETAVGVGDVVRLSRLGRQSAEIVEIVVPPDSGLVGRPVTATRWPDGAALLMAVRDGVPVPRDRQAHFAAGDALFLATPRTAEERIRDLVRARAPSGPRSP